MAEWMDKWIFMLFYAQAQTVQQSEVEMHS